MTSHTNSLTLLFEGSVSLRNAPNNKNTRTDVRQEKSAGYWKAEKPAGPAATVFANDEK